MTDLAELADHATDHGFKGTDVTPEIALGEYHMLAKKVDDSRWRVLWKVNDRMHSADEPQFRFRTVGTDELNEWIDERAPLSFHGAESPEDYRENCPEIHRLWDYLFHGDGRPRYGRTYTAEQARGKLTTMAHAA